jgi:integrase
MRRPAKSIPYLPVPGVRVMRVALSAAGLADFHFHDLRHSGNTLAAGAGATLRELMDRMGHDSERAAMIYTAATPASTGSRTHSASSPGRN